MPPSLLFYYHCWRDMDMYDRFSYLKMIFMWLMFRPLHYVRCPFTGKRSAILPMSHVEALLDVLCASLQQPKKAAGLEAFHVTCDEVRTLANGYSGSNQY
jgi:hypothetical protein